METLTASPVDPILFVGLDIGVKRDTTGIAAVYQDYESGFIHLWGHRIFTPPVAIERQVLPVLLGLFENQRVAQLLFDPMQAATLEQKLREKGYGSKLMEINQLTRMTEACNILHTCLNEGKLLLYPDKDVRSHFAVAAARHTERGWRIVKQKQSRPIDVVVALAMALLGLTDQVGHALHPSFQPAFHARSFWSLP